MGDQAYGVLSGNKDATLRQMRPKCLSMSGRDVEEGHICNRTGEINVRDASTFEAVREALGKRRVSYTHLRAHETLR